MTSPRRPRRPAPSLADVTASMAPAVRERFLQAIDEHVEANGTTGKIPAARGNVAALTNGDMNRTETAYANVLDARKAAGEVAWWRFGAVNLRIGDKCFYRTDFMVLLADGLIEIHETKGFMRDDAQVKLRAIREMYPFFGLVVVRKGKGGIWEYERR